MTAPLKKLDLDQRIVGWEQVYSNPPSEAVRRTKNVVIWLDEHEIFHVSFQPGAHINTIELIELIDAMEEIQNKQGLTQQRKGIYYSHLNTFQPWDSLMVEVLKSAKKQAGAAAIVIKNGEMDEKFPFLAAFSKVMPIRVFGDQGAAAAWLNDLNLKRRKKPNGVSIQKRRLLLGLFSLHLSAIGIWNLMGPSNPAIWAMSVVQVLFMSVGVLLVFKNNVNRAGEFYSFSNLIFVIGAAGLTGGIDSPLMPAFFAMTAIGMILVESLLFQGIFFMTLVLSVSCFFLLGLLGVSISPIVEISSIPHLYSVVYVPSYLITLIAILYFVRNRSGLEGRLKSQNMANVGAAETILQSLNQFLALDFGNDDRMEAQVIERADPVLVAIREAVVALGQSLKSSVVSLDFFTKLADSIQEYLIVVDAEFEVVFANRPMADLIGRDPVGLSMNDFVAGLAPRPALLPSEQTTVTYEIRVDEVSKPVLLLASKLPLAKFEKGSPPYFAISMVNVEDRLQFEREKERLLFENLQAGKLASIGTLVAGVGHELNNPLAVVKMGIERVLSTGEVDVELLERVMHNVSRLEAIVNQLRTFAREQKPEDWGLVEFSSCISQSVAAFELELKSNKIEVTVDLPQRLEIDGNEVSLESIFRNLISNSIGAFSENVAQDFRWIKIYCDEEASITEVRIVYEDNAGGMTADQLDQVFNPFFSTKEVGKGMGLGLSLVRNSVKLHGGEIKAESELGKGVRFFMTFQREKKRWTSRDREVLEVADRRIDSTVATHSKGRSTVVVIDDEPDLAEILKFSLEQEFDVEIFGTLKDAEKFLDQGEVDLVITDMMMPKTSGADLVRALKRLTLAPIVVFSGLDEGHPIVKESIKAGAISYLPKPLPQESNLIAEIHHLIVQGRAKRAG